jgi:ABC-2 type transport system permease protein
MRKILVIAAREYQASVKTKAFIISLVVMPLLMGGSILVQVLVKGVGEDEVKRFAVVDRTGGRGLAPMIAGLQKAPLPKTGSPTERKLLEMLKGAAGQPKDQVLFHVIRKVAEDPAMVKQMLGKKYTFAVERVEPGKDDPGDEDRLRYELSEKVRKGQLEGFVEIGRDVFSMPAAQPAAKGRQTATPGKASLAGAVPDERVVRYQSNKPTNDAFALLVSRLVTAFVQQWRFQNEGLDAQRVLELVKPVELKTQGLTKREAGGKLVTAPDQNRMAAFLLPFGLMMLMFMVIMVGATPLIQGIVEEKQLRIAEVLLGSVRPFELMMGKLVGMVGVSLTLAAVYLAGAYWLAEHFNYTDYLAPDIIAWFLVYQTLAVAMFGALFIAIGAACTDTKETQTMLMPVMLLACVPLFVWNIVIQEPASSFATGMSFFPFATPMLMMARLAVPPGIAVWQPLLGVAVVLATTVLCVYAAGRIFRVGILMQGKGARFGEMLRWVFRG